MSRALSKSLGTDLAALAQVLRSKGRGRDTVLAHITPKEAALLKSRGGRGSINPDTGLPEFEDGDFGFDYGGGGEDFTPYLEPSNVYQTPSAPQQELPVVNDESTWGNLQPSAPQQELPPPASDQATWDKLQSDKPGFMDKLGSYLSDPANLAKLGLLGAGGLFGAKQGQTAAAQTQTAVDKIGAIPAQITDRSAAAQEQLKNIAANARTTGAQSAQDLAALGAPARELGTGMMSGAVSGNLTPANQASLAALKARAEQDISKRGGVGAMQAGVAEESAQAQLAQQQLQQGLATYQQGAAYSQQAIALQQAQDNMAAGIQQQSVNTALQQAGIADQYTVNAIMTGLQMDAATAASLKNFYTSLAQVGFGQIGSALKAKFDSQTGAPIP